MNEALETGVSLDRRKFIAGAAAFGLIPWRVAAFSESAEKSRLLPALPKEKPLDFRLMADSFDSYVMNPDHGVVKRDSHGRQLFVSALEATEDGGLTCFGPMAVGRELRGNGLEELSNSLLGYYSEPYGLFLDGPGATLCEYWYMMNVNALAFALVRLRFANSLEWIARVERSAMRLRQMAQKIQYNFNDQAYDFAKDTTWTKLDIYRQPDAIGGYSYVMLLAWKLTGKDVFLTEAKIGIDRYLAFDHNPWYEVPSGAMATLAAAYLQSSGYAANAGKALKFVLDPNVGLMATGEWGGKAVDGLMAGFCTEPKGQAYSMESMVTLPYLIPAVRYRPELADSIARYALNVAANLRWFYPEYLPPENQSRPDLRAMVPYERLNHEDKGKSPYAEGDYAGHRSVYGGAYMMWLDKMAEPQTEPWLLRWNLNTTNFLDHDLAQAYLYYNPFSTPKRVRINGAKSVKDLAHGEIIAAKNGVIEMQLKPLEARVVEVS
jgi:hypothetical protein